jgi:hypothetical protein
MSLCIQETYWDKKSLSSIEFQIHLESISTVLLILRSPDIWEFHFRGVVTAGRVSCVTKFRILQMIMIFVFILTVISHNIYNKIYLKHINFMARSVGCDILVYVIQF